MAETYRSGSSPGRGCRMLVSERDEEIMAELFAHRVMSRSQIGARFFSSTARTNARLRQLFDGRYVRRHFPEYAPWGAQAVYSLGSNGVPIVAGRLGRSESEVRRLSDVPGPQLLRHTLAVVDFHISLLAALERSPGVTLDLWMPEMLARHEYEYRRPGSGEWTRTVFAPDAYLRLSGRQGPASYFLEMDLGTTSLPQWEKKLRQYRRYRDAGLFASRYAAAEFTVLTPTTGERRIAHLLDVVKKAGGPIVLFASRDKIEAHGPLRAAWRGTAGDRRII